MRKVLLVDDEMFVRKGLKELIPWEAFGYEVIAEAEDGEEAVQLIDLHGPDLVLTDIRMPVMDGLSLIETVKESGGRAPEFVILSGYNEFSYAQRAMRFGVQDFILKPIDDGELTETLTRMNRRLASRDEKGGRQRTADAVLNELLFEGADGAPPADLEAVLRLGQGSCCYVIAERNGCGESAEAEAQSLRQWKSAIGEALMRLGGGAPIVHDLSPYTFGFLLTSSHLSDSGSAQLERLGARLLHRAGGEEGGFLRLYLGPIVDRPADLKRSYEAARDAMNAKFALDDRQVLTAGMASQAGLAFRDLDEDVYAALQEGVEENDIPLLSGLVARIGADFKRHAFTTDAVMASLSKCVVRVLDTLRRMNEGQEPELASLAPLMQWNQTPKTLGMLLKKLEPFLAESAACMEQLRKRKTTGGIHRVRQYIESHFNEEITLKGMAKRFYINPVYLGQLFKNTYGVYFNDFLLQLRIGEAKRLLRQTDRKIYEIAELVGFSSSEYFIKQFEKVEGCSPTEYKQAQLTRTP
ncbi:response regulator transcription factor [Paenibacillus methanolicus]|uniref:Two-component system response regulator YesN n=1 Tax=Paenibacillus methanolicus TaxID=582686 RepID=A0A5S5C7S5_9BACL|nr:response regulator transcription factor [Paenibacillus methanolicus]TYP74658.1 two-component system response regulator YesN [Paenibacillus methanolicus]